MKTLYANSSQQDTETGYTIEIILREFNKGRLTDGVYRWYSNDNVPFSDMLNDFRALNLIDAEDVLRSETARNRDNERHWVEYREAQQNRTPSQIAEQRAEARAAMGPNVDMINVLTGERYTT
mgnify:CR=1 FL=1